MRPLLDTPALTKYIKMRSRVKEVPEVQWLQPRDPAIPAICYDSCNNANLEAQSVGESPELCDPDSAFMIYYNACKDCVDSNGGDSTDRDYLSPVFAQWIGYCDSTTVTGGMTMTGAPATPSIAVTVLVSVLYTTTIDGVKTVWPLTKTLTSYVPLPDTTVISITTSQDGHDTVWTFVKTLTPLANVSLADTSPSPSTARQQTSQVSDSTSTNPTGTTMSDNSHGIRAWLAGPVIGSIAGAVVIMLAVWFLFRIIKRRRNDLKGHELHGQSALVLELEQKIKALEMHGQGENTHPVELPGNAF
ncbi:hypothetical protein F5Y10DRAFT_255371 [Nemania abortiva]|nr:hypothetical protein F5Y10DRAFT_255371 [Nemania abortiva]